MKEALLLPYLYHYWDPTAQIKTPDLNRGFELTETAKGFAFERLVTPGKEATFGETNSNHWFRFCLHNISDQAQNLVVAFEPPTLSMIDFYPQKSGLPSFKTGNIKTMDTRDIPNPHFDFNVRLLPHEQQTFYVRAYAKKNPFLQANVWDRQSYDVDTNKSETLFGLFVGVLLGLVFYHILLFVSSRQSISLIYIGWSLSVFILLSSVNGRLVQYLAPSYPQWGVMMTEIFSAVSIYLFAFLCEGLMQIKNYPKSYRFGRVFLAISLLPLVGFYFYGPADYSLVCIALAIFVFLYYSLIMPVFTWFKDRLVAAKYVLIIQAPLIVFIVDRGLFGLNISNDLYIPYKLTTAIMPVMILVSYYIGLMAHREKEAAQRSALKQLNISNDLKNNYNAQLKQELEQKTADIQLMNSDLEAQAEKLLQLDQSKSQFFANISHEFRTPLTLIEGPLTVLLEREGFTDKGIIEGVLRNSNSLKSLIDQVLLLSELDEQSLHLTASKLNVVQAVNGFSAQFQSLVEQKGIRLDFNATEPDIQAYVDQEKLQIIINNLLSNAIKFSQPSALITVSVSATAIHHEEDFSRDEYVNISVSDTGQGIPSDELAFIFDRYFQSSSSELSKAGLGTGIGLALVKELVELHAGEVTVKSVYRERANEGATDTMGTTSATGTSFCVTLPLGRAHLNDNEVVQNIDSQAECLEVLAPQVVYQECLAEPVDALAHKKPSILVVDDNEDIRQHIKHLLEAQYTVIMANDGLLAEKALSEHRPDLIVTDLMMPNRNGLEFVESIKKNAEFANIPIVMLTARASLDDRVSGLMAAVDDYLVKPFNGRELKARIKNLLNKQAQFAAFYQSKVIDVNDKSQVQQESYVDKVKVIVNQRLMEPDFGVDELAKALHVSEATLRRRISEHAHFTPAAFIRHCRLEKARDLSLQGNVRSIKELAKAVGFSQPSYFARLYQRTFNCDVEVHC